jgi:tagaturonate epimerase
MKFGQLEFNPAVNPGVLDTGTWNLTSAWEAVQTADYDWAAAKRAATERRPLPPGERLKGHDPSVACRPEAVYFLASLPDGQDVILGVGRKEEAALLGPPLGQCPLPSGDWLTAFPTDDAVLDRFCRKLEPEKGPRALGATPRLGIGTRMTTAVWPAIFETMQRRGLAANALQNSVRELNLLEDLRAGQPPEKNYSTGIGTVECGWTGSTYEGLWVAGVLAALKHNGALRYGADADHLQVKRGPEGVARAKRLIRAARHYSFYTLDLADILNYAALNEPSASAAGVFLEQAIPDAMERRGVIEYHTKPFRAGGQTCHPDPAAVGRFVGKYWDTLAVLGELAADIASLKEEPRFDLELTVDEHPPEVAAFDCLTTNEEVLFLAREIQRRQLPVSHLAPNFGQEKGCDYRCPDGLGGLAQRVEAQFQIAEEFGLMLDVHSGDDLSAATRRVFGRATGGKLHFKVSPMPQLIFAEVLEEFHPELFRRWWEDTLAYAQREAAHGSPIARDCLAQLQASAHPRPSSKHAVFHHFSFPFVGRRNPQGQFLHRHEFYTLSAAFSGAHQERLAAYLGELADDLF